VQKTQGRTKGTLGGIVSFLGTVDDVLPYLNTTINELENAKKQLAR
jgi:hypothetical protein